MNYTIERYTTPSGYGACMIGQDFNTSAWSGTINAVGVGDVRHGYGNWYKKESGFIFAYINLPADAIINTAYLVLTNWYGEGIVNTRISVQDSINAANFVLAGTYADYIARSRLPALDWDGLTGWIWDTHNTRDFSASIQSLIATYGAFVKASIGVFWGDVDGRTVAPTFPLSNSIVSTGAVYVAKLRIEFSTATPIPTPDPSRFWQLSNIKDAENKVDDQNIINDFRYLMPSWQQYIDYSVSPPVLTWVDYVNIRRDAISEQRYGRRTRINKSRQGFADYWGDELCDKEIKRLKEPVPSMKVSTVPVTDEDVEQALSTDISDKLLIDINRAGLSKKYWIDNKTLTLNTGKIDVEYGLGEIMATTNVTGLFEVDIDHVDELEEVLG